MYGAAGGERRAECLQGRFRIVDGVTAPIWLLEHNGALIARVGSGSENLSAERDENGEMCRIRRRYGTASATAK